MNWPGLQDTSLTSKINSMCICSQANPWQVNFKPPFTAASKYEIRINVTKVVFKFSTLNTTAMGYFKEKMKKMQIDREAYLRRGAASALLRHQFSSHWSIKILILQMKAMRCREWKWLAYGTTQNTHAGRAGTFFATRGDTRAKACEGKFKPGK